jgi:hypothetical protein
MGFNPLDKLYHKLLATAGICAPTMDQLKDYLEKSEQYTERARTLQNFISASPSLPNRLKSASEAISAIREHVETLQKRVGDVSAACEISSAIKTLNGWAADPNGDSAVAAAAFDRLFGGIAHYAAKLPTPVGQYSKILEQLSISQFFTRMQDLMSPTGNTPRGRAMREALEAVDQPFLPPARPAP